MPSQAEAKSQISLLTHASQKIETIAYNQMSKWTAFQARTYALRVAEAQSYNLPNSAYQLLGSRSVLFLNFMDSNMFPLSNVVFLVLILVLNATCGQSKWQLVPEAQKKSAGLCGGLHHISPTSFLRLNQNAQWPLS